MTRCPVETGPGQISLQDSPRPFTVDIPKSVTHFVIEVPRDELAARIGPTEKAPGRPYSARSPEGMLATGFVRQSASHVARSFKETYGMTARDDRGASRSSE